MTMSILHRITGAALYFGTLLVAWWLIAAATSQAHFDFVNALFGSWFGRRCCSATPGRCCTICSAASGI